MEVAGAPAPAAETTIGILGDKLQIPMNRQVSSTHEVSLLTWFIPGGFMGQTITKKFEAIRFFLRNPGPNNCHPFPPQPDPQPAVPSAGHSIRSIHEEPESKALVSGPYIIHSMV